MKNANNKRLGWVYDDTLLAANIKRTERFINRRVTPLKAVGELVGLTSLIAVWVLACAI